MKDIRILAIFHSSWGEVDWVLPLLWKLKETSKIYVYLQTTKIVEQKDQYTDLNRLLQETADRVFFGPALQSGLSSIGVLRVSFDFCFRFFFNFLKKIILTSRRDERQSVPIFLKSAVKESRPISDFLFLRRLLRSEHIDLLMHDISMVSKQNANHLYALFPDTRIVIYPHSTYPYKWRSHNRNNESIEHLRVKMQNVPKDGIFLVNFSDDISHFDRLCPDVKYIVIPPMKLEKQWKYELWKAVPSSKPSDGKIDVLVISSRTKDPDLYIELARTIFRIALKYKFRLHIRLHPRISSNVFAKLSYEYQDVEIDFVKSSILGATRNCEIAISFPSSGCMDAVAAGIPVIEFFDYEREDWVSFVKDTNGMPISIFARSGIVYPVTNENALEAILDDTIFDRSKRRILAARQTEALETLLQLKENKTMNGATEFLERIDA